MHVSWRARLGDLIAGRRPVARRFDAARQTRLTFGWGTQSAAMNADLRMDLDALRARSRDLTANNDYARKFLAMVGANMVGSGFTMQSRAAKPNGEPDKADQDAVERAFADWAMPGECDVTGRHGFEDVCRLLVRGIARDGEALVRRVRDRRFKYGYRLQVLDIERLETKYNDTLATGNRVGMSVEIDGYGRPVAYHLLMQHPGEDLRGQTQKRERVPADEVFHLFIADRPEQLRGIPWMHTAMLRLQMLQGYEEAAIVAARTGAAKMGFFVSPDGTGKSVSDGEDEQGNFVTDAEAGAFHVLPEGYDFKPWSPEYPTQNYDTFVKATLRGLASGLNVAYNSLANDLEGVNFSSIRSGTLEERDQWVVLQNWFIGAFLRPLFIDWIETALISGAVAMFNGSPLPAGKLDKYRAHAWQGRRWSWVDPLKDIEASVLAIEYGLASPYTIAAQQGLDVDDVLTDIARWRKAASDKGVPLGKPAPVNPAATPADEAVKILAARSLETRDAPPPPAINLHQGAIHVHQGDTRVENALPAPEVRVEVAPPAVQVAVAAPVVTIEPAAVECRVEAIMPEQAAPVVEVNVDLPAEMKIAALPARETTSTVTRDSAGNIVSTKQTERDAHP